jgi:lysozyme
LGKNKKEKVNGNKRKSGRKRSAPAARGSRKRKKYRMKIGPKQVALIVILLLILVLCIRCMAGGNQSTKVVEVRNDSIPYPIRGVDVSSYQGDIDWDVLAGQDISFAYIKATEGVGHVDKNFKTNWRHANKTSLRVGAYHFMSFKTSGERQAKHFISTVREKDNMLPPVVDVELHGKYSNDPPSVEELDAILVPLLTELKKEYELTPIIYTNTHVYNQYISHRYKNPVWIADPDMPSLLPDGKEWVFCQYSYSGQMDGYSGGTEHIDLNVFHGDKAAFLDL